MRTGQRAGSGGNLGRMVRIPLQVSAPLRLRERRRDFPRFRLIIQFVHTDLRQEVGAFVAPTHLSLFGHPVADDLVDG